MSRRRNKRLLSLVATLIILALSLAGQQFGWFDEPVQNIEDQNPGLYSITRFVDGDTITVDMNGTNETVRMIGIDTPETHKPNTPVQCYGPAAAAYTKNLIGQQKVRLEADPTNQNRDRYNRLLRYVYLPDGRMVEEELIKNGYAFAYTSFPFTKKQAFIALEEKAKTASRGLWGNCEVTDENGRKQTNSTSKTN